jgi:hypothetical protein
MSFEEKIQAMELLWDDLSNNNEPFKSPDWHQDVLAQRENAIKEGAAEYIDWETAKKNIKDQCE